MTEIPFSLENRVSLITGAAGHLGSAMAAGLATAGSWVFLNGRNEEKLEQLRQRIVSGGGRAHVLPFDVRDAASGEAAIARIASLAGRLDVLVNNAYAGGGGTLSSSSREEFLAAFDVSVAAAAGLSRAAADLLASSALSIEGGSSIINVASMYGLVSPDPRLYASPETTNPPFYGAAKAALIQLTRYLACELGPRHIRVNAVAPGPFPSEGVQSTDPRFVGRLAKRVPLGRIGSPRELAGPVVFLASPAASFVNGAVLSVDGGWTVW